MASLLMCLLHRHSQLNDKMIGKQNDDGDDTRERCGVSAVSGVRSVHDVT